MIEGQEGVTRDEWLSLADASGRFGFRRHTARTTSDTSPEQVTARLPDLREAKS